jgi:hypothetical protein
MTTSRHGVGEETNTMKVNLGFLAIATLMLVYKVTTRSSVAVA